MSATQQDLVRAVVDSGVTDERIIEAFASIPRAGFVPEHSAALAYVDQPIPIAHDQVTTQPSLSAMMIEALDLTPSDRVLEVGTGLGFQTALLAHLAREVVTIEMWEDLAETAESNLRRHGITRVDIHVGDGSLGVSHLAPYDAILVSAAFPRVPAPLADQLVEGGRLVQPMGRGGSEIVTLHRRSGKGLRRVRDITPARFVRLIGEEGFPS